MKFIVPYFPYRSSLKNMHPQFARPLVMQLRSTIRTLRTSSCASADAFGVKSTFGPHTFAGKARRISHATLSTSASAAASVSLSGAAASSAASAAGGRKLASRLLKFLAVGGCTGAVLYGSNYYYQNVFLPRQRAPQAQLLAIEPPGEFQHPYDSAPWYYKTYIVAKRFVFLLFVMAPCLAVSVIVRLKPEDEAWRQYWLDLLVKTMERAGCSFQKFGQWLSMRPDVFESDVIKALSTLRSDIAAHSYPHTRRMIREAFGVEIEELFDEFDEEPVASGTVAQVHRGVLKPEHAVHAWNGELIREVAVKVRHPQVLEEIWMDGDIIYRLVNMSEVMTIPFSKDEFMNMIQKQIDFRWEAYNISLFAHNFQQEMKTGHLNIPEVSQDLLSSAVLIESWVPGKTVSNILSDVGNGFKHIGDAMDRFSDAVAAKKRALAQTVFDLNMKMYLRDNLVHGDLHAGNILYDEEGDRCTVLDFGVTTRLGEDMRAHFGGFLHALCTGNADGLTDKLVAFHANDAPADIDALRNDVRQIMSKWIDPKGNSVSPTGDMISLGDILGEVCFALQRRGLVLRGDVATVLMGMSISEGLIRTLDPDFDVVRHSLPYYIRYGVASA